MASAAAPAQAPVAAPAQAPKGAQGKHKIPKGTSLKLDLLAYFAHPKVGKCACARTAKGLMLCQPKAKVKAQTKAQDTASAAAPAQAPVAAPAQAPKGAQTPMKAPE
ncbi:PREDICTED: 60S ribosomal protein L29-like [Galeopterus variegatus]|uniref:60S ribosomal protein L29-like n=1 Tax=Galeopterus variegatus TaxID=482537 RepID=A0ABM0S8U9_GALVR|nr:PREDICTED: 60S ribosomal protein L29-like [Galeopterus variegatus]